jgi:hypothetical protein
MGKSPAQLEARETGDGTHEKSLVWQHRSGLTVGGKSAQLLSFTYRQRE